MKYTREQLVEMGMDEAQIDAIMNTLTSEEKSDSNVVVMAQQSGRSKNNNDLLSVTTIDDLRNYASGTIVRFPDFADGQPLVARVRRPSMLVMAKSGKIPNALLSSAGELFTKGGSDVDVDNPNLLSDMYDVCHLIAEATLIEPTLEDIEGVGLQLTDDQLTTIFNYCQLGVKALDSFREV